MDAIDMYRSNATIDRYDDVTDVVLDIITNTDAPLAVAVAAAVLMDQLNWCYDNPYQPDHPGHRRAVKVLDPDNEDHYVIIHS